MNNTQKLPKWAQERIRELERQRDEALKALNQWKDDQKPSKFSSTFPLCTGEAQGPTFKEVFFHPCADGITVRHSGIELMVSAFEDEGIHLRWSAQNTACGEVAFIPTSFQNACMKHPSKLRK